MADKKPAQPPHLTGTNAPPPRLAKPTRAALTMREIMKDSVVVEKARRISEEVVRDSYNELKLMETVKREKAESPARAGTGRS